VVQVARRFVTLAVALATLMTAVAFSVSPAAVAGEYGTFGSVDPPLEQCLLDMHNEERTSRGLHPLVPDASLTTYARAWSFEMEESDYFRHSDLSVPGTWYGVGENISWSQGYGYGCTWHHEGFMDSSGHRANILRPSFDRVGIGIVYDPSQNGIIHVTVVFGDSDGTNGPAPTPGDPEPVPDLPPTPCASSLCDGFVAVDSGGRWRVFDIVGDNEPLDFYFGNPGDVPFMGDWDGDGTATPGLYRQSDGYVYLRNSNTQGNADVRFFFGDPGDFPLVGDWDGDGKDTVSIYRQSEGRVYIVNALGSDGGGLGVADFSYGFGNPGDKPFTGDFDGDGIDTIGLYRESTGFVYFTNRLATGIADLSFFYGNPGDQILAGDWDGDGDDTVAVYRPSTGRVYVNLENTNGADDWNGYVGSYPWVITAGGP